MLKKLINNFYIEFKKIYRARYKSVRERKVFHDLNKAGLGLEIGPSFNPLAPKAKGYNVHILDHASTSGLKEKYQGHGVNLDNIEEVDFVWHGEKLQDLIGNTECYDWIIASHVIEHTPCLVSFLQQCEVLLKPGGILSLAVPDKRYCFDYFSPISSTGQILDAWSTHRIKPSAGQVFDHYANAAKRYNSISWRADGLGGANELVHSLQEAKTQWGKASSTEDYIDVHCWRFIPKSFEVILSDLKVLNLICLSVKSTFKTVGCEFYVSLCKQNDTPMTHDRLAFLKEIKKAKV